MTVRPPTKPPSGAAAAVALVVAAAQHAEDERRAAVPQEEPLSPDCRAGKCSACVGDAWSDLTDSLTACGHGCHA